MKGNLALGIVLMLIAMGMSSIVVKIDQVKAFELIYIREDGSIEPKEANITTADLIIYNFAGNNYGRIEIERGNVVLNGLGYSLEGANSGNGIFFRDISNVTLKNLTIRNFDIGINIYNSSQNRIQHNNITDNNDFGIYIYDSLNNTVSDNKIMNNGGYNYGGYSAIDISYSHNNTLHRNNITENLFLDGVGLWASSNNSIYDNVMASNYMGIRYDQSSSHNHVHTNNISSSLYGIYLIQSTNNTLNHNLLDDVNYGFYVYGEELSQYLHDIDTSNLVDGKPVYYLINHNNDSIRPPTHPEIGFLALINSTNITVERNNLTNNGLGLLFAYTKNSRIAYNNITHNYDGVKHYRSFNNSITGNNIVGNEYRGIYLWDSNGTTMSENSIVDNGELGIYLSDASNNILYGNTIAHSDYAIELGGHNNSIYLNNFVNNTQQIDSYDFENFWDNGLEGNYWSDYNGNDTNNDGIGETPYEIDPNNNDTLPLLGMFYGFNASLTEQVYVICNSTVNAAEYSSSTNTINLLVSNISENQTFGFIRICIPHTLMNETYHVTVNGTAPHYFNYNLSDNGTHRWIYFTYEHSMLEIAIVPEFSCLVILPLLLIATMLGAIVYKKRQERQPIANGN